MSNETGDCRLWFVDYTLSELYLVTVVLPLLVLFLSSLLAPNSNQRLNLNHAF